MAYSVNNTSGTVITTIADGTIDNTTDLTLIGKNYSGYGELLNENFVALLENFAANSQPASPVVGQLWWDTSTSSSGLLKVYDGTAFKIVSGATASASEPSAAIAGDLWFDTTNQQLYVNNGTGSPVLIGPAAPSSAGTTGAIVETVVDNVGSNHIVIKMFVNDTVVAIVSKDSTFTPQTSIGGFATINPGIQLSSSVTGATFRGDATNAQLLDNLDSSQFLRSDTNDTTSGVLTVNNNGGVVIGGDNDLTLTVSGSTAQISNSTADGDIDIKVNKSVGGVTDALLIDGATGAVSIGVTPATADDSAKVASTGWVTDNAIMVDGSSTMQADLLPQADSTYDLGSSSFKWANVYADTLNGTAVEALYADLAERFEADQPYEAGTVVALGGDKEITAVAEECSDDVFGVVSGQAAYLMNSGAGNKDTHPAVAMTGRVPVKVLGTVLKGQRLVSSDTPGYARAASSGEATGLNTLGRALEDKYTKEAGTVMSVVKVN